MLDQHEKSELLETLMALKDEIRESREERLKQQVVHVDVHLKQPRVSLDTVLLSLAASLIALGGFWACVQPAVQR